MHSSLGSAKYRRYKWKLVCCPSRRLPKWKWLFPRNTTSCQFSFFLGDI